jgi:glycosyltransferase involved in cell wall biosynthesis
MSKQTTIDLSVLIPVFNEVGNVELLHEELDGVLRRGTRSYELIFVDDGSTDGTTAKLETIQGRDPAHVRVIRLRRNCGQTAALSAALDKARGEILVPIDGDRQNDPADIPRLLEQIEAGYDVVSGWRKKRHDDLFTRKIPSWLANRLVAKVSGVPLHDFGCTLKAYRRGVLKGMRLYGEMHRFIAIYAAWEGGRVKELIVNHRPRTAGKTKYGLGRTLNVILDLIWLRFLKQYQQRPLHFFGRFGMWSFGLGLLSIFAMLYFKYVFPWPYLWWGADAKSKTFIETPLPSLTVMFFLFGVMGILLGIQAEVVMRTYYESQAKTTYRIEEIGPETADDESEAQDREGPSDAVRVESDQAVSTTRSSKSGSRSPDGE